MELIENELLQIIKLFNYIHLIFIFTSLIHFTKRVKRLNKSDECFLLKRKSDLEDALRKEFTLQVRTKCTSSGLKSFSENRPIVSFGKRNVNHVKPNEHDS